MNHSMPERSKNTIHDCPYSWSKLSVAAFMLAVLTWNVSIDEAKGSGVISYVDKTAANIHYIFDFYPKYKKKECLIGIRWNFKEGAWVDPNEALWEYFNKYLYEHEPKAIYIFASPKNQTANRYYLFIDECPRRYEIMDNILDNIRRKYPEIVAHAVHEEITDDMVDRESGSGMWLDDPLYDEKYWKIRRNASETCDPEAWLRVAQEMEKSAEDPGEVGAVYIYAKLASIVSGDDPIIRNKTKKYLEHVKNNLEVTETNAIVGDRLIIAYIEAKDVCKKRLFSVR